MEEIALNSVEWFLSEKRIIYTIYNSIQFDDQAVALTVFNQS